jgi:MFS family permease
MTPLRRNRDFVLLWTGMAVSVLGSRISSTAYPLLVLALTHSPAKAGLVGFLATLPYLLFQLPAGGLVDRWNRKQTMILCDVGRFAALGSLAIALWLGHLTLAQIGIVAFGEGTLFVFFNLAETGAIRQVVPAEQLPAALAQNEARNRGAGLAGPPLGGLLFGLGRFVPFLVDALSYVVSLAALLLIRAEFQFPLSEKPLEPPRSRARVPPPILLSYQHEQLERVVEREPSQLVRCADRGYQVPLFDRSLELRAR